MIERAAVIADVAETMRDLFTSKDPDEAIDRGLRAARSLLDVDIAAWMSVEENMLVSRAQSGMARPEGAAGLRIPVASALGAGAVVEDLPLIVEDVSASSSFGSADSAAVVAREGIASMVAVPVKARDEVSGVLYVFSRSRRKFTEYEIRAVQAIATLVSVIEPQLVEHGRLGEALDAARAREYTATREDCAVRLLVDQLLDGVDLDVALAEAAAYLGVSLSLQRTKFGAADTPSYLRPGTLPAIEVPIPGTDGAHLRGSAADGLSSGTLHRIADMIGLEFSRHRTRLETELRLTDDWVRNLLTAADHELDALWKRASLVGIDVQTPRIVLAFGHDRPVDRSLLDRMAHGVRAMSRHSQVTVYDGDVVALVPVSAKIDELGFRKLAEGVVEDCRPVPLRAGVGGLAQVAADYPMAVREALFSLQIARRGTASEKVVDVRQLGMYRLFAQVVDANVLQKAIEGTLGPLMRTDQSDGGDLLHTLRVFLEHDRKYAESSRTLHVHVNTLRYRIARVEKLLSADLSDPDVRFSLLLALRVSLTLGVT
ncbi:MAG: helix-turn-helix domain-containing protein [Rhodococcus sp. (in: high G+C Gram-positive bacteria)]|uniref:helix-turn-helix domain-containing protein n=1 Tax=Rhodococcus sp. TaxID=1831 RepID=UPI003BB0A6D1